MRPQAKNMAVVLAALSLLPLSALTWGSIAPLVGWPSGAPVALSADARALSVDAAVTGGELSPVASDASEVSNLLLAFGVRRTDAHAAELSRPIVAPLDLLPTSFEPTPTLAARRSDTGRSRARAVRAAASGAVRRTPRPQCSARHDARPAASVSVGVERRQTASKQAKIRKSEGPERAEVLGDEGRAAPAADAPQCPSDALRMRTRL